MAGTSKYTDEMGRLICERIADGESVRTICLDEAMPAQSTVFKWLADNAKFSEQYTRAKEAQIELMADEILAIADDSKHDTVTVGHGESSKEVADNEWINRSRLRVDTRKWLMSKLAPKKYGDKLQVDGDMKVTRIILRDEAPALSAPDPKPEFED